MNKENRAWLEAIGAFVGILAFIIFSFSSSTKVIRAYLSSHSEKLQLLCYIVTGIYTLLLVVRFFFASLNSRTTVTKRSLRTLSNGKTWVWREKIIRTPFSVRKVVIEGIAAELVNRASSKELTSAASSVSHRKEVGSVIGLMLRRKGSDTTRLSFLALGLLLIGYLALPIDMLLPFSLVVGGATLLQLCSYFLLVFRVRKGFYGSTASEVKEILQFIKDNSDNDIFRGGKGNKLKIFPENEKAFDAILDGVPVHGEGK